MDFLENKEIGNKIKLLRKRARLTQKQLAEGICTQAQISNIEKGVLNPSSNIIYGISEKLRVDTNSFFNKNKTFQNEHVDSVKKIIRKLIRSRDYKSLSYVIQTEKDNPLFQNDENKQFMLWHEGICDYYLEKDVTLALKKIEGALNIKAPHKERMAEIMNSLAIIYNEEGDYEEALLRYRKAIELLDNNIEVINNHVKIRVFYGMSKCLTDMKKHSESLEFSEKGKALCIEGQTLYLLGELIYQTGLNYFKLGHKELGFSHYDKAYMLFKLQNNQKFADIVAYEKYYFENN